MGKLAGKIRNTATKAASAVFTKEEIERRSRGSHNGESMQQVYARIMNDPNLERRQTKPGVYDLVYTKDGEENIIGWMDQNRGMGEISQKGYDLLEIPKPEENDGYGVEDGIDEISSGTQEILAQKHDPNMADDREIPEFALPDEEYDATGDFDFGDE